MLAKPCLWARLSQLLTKNRLLLIVIIPAINNTGMIWPQWPVCVCNNNSNSAWPYTAHLPPVTVPASREDSRGCCVSSELSTKHCTLIHSHTRQTIALIDLEIKVQSLNLIQSVRKILYYYEFLTFQSCINQSISKKAFHCIVVNTVKSIVHWSWCEKLLWFSPDVNQCRGSVQLPFVIWD